MEDNHQARPEPFIGSGRVLENRLLARDTFLLTIHCPEVATLARPGSFIKLRTWSEQDIPLLDRPLSLHRVCGENVQLLCRVVGRATTLMSRAAPGDQVKLSGPLGRSLDDIMSRPAPLYLVGGGIGLAPLALVRDWLGKEDSHIFYGERNGEMQVEENWLSSWADNLTATVEDGRGYGQKGLVTAPLALALKKECRPIFACGPTPMLRAVSQLAADCGTPAWVCLEAGMACGFGICLTCSLPLKGGDRLRVCQEGPVVDGSTIDWEKVS